MIRDAKLMPKGVADVGLRAEVSRNVFLRDGDLVYIPDNVAKKVFVLGEVQRPDAVQIERNTVSLAEVLAVCRGPTPARARRELAIIRGGFDKPTVYIVDLEKAGHPGCRHWCPGHEQRDQVAAAGRGAMTPTWACAEAPVRGTGLDPGPPLLAPRNVLGRRDCPPCRVGPVMLHG
jgi:hypothetical protein